MKDFIKVIKEINRKLGFLLFFEVTLDAAIFFLIIFLLLSLVNLYPTMAVIPTFFYFAIRLYLNSKSDKRKMVESKYAPLKEKLRTAADNYKKQNQVVDELEEEVVNDLRNIGPGSFVQTKAISYKIFSAILLSFVIVFATTLNLYVVDISLVFGEIPELLEKLDPRKIDNSALGEINESEDIYGDSKLAVLGNEEIDIKIKPVNYEVNVREEGDVEEKQFDEIFPSDVAVEQSSSFEEDIPEEQQELVKNYFNKLTS